MKIHVWLALIFWLAAASWSHAIVTIEWVTVGNPGNLNNPLDGSEATPGFQNFGAVAYVYQISKYETTNAQYAEFLNAADPNGTNPNGIYNTAMAGDARGGITYTSGAAAGSKYAVKTNMGGKPVNFVSILDAQRFANWMHNGQGSGSTETGAYTVSSLAVHNSNATVWIPTENEWYKAAYYDPTLNSGTGGYWLWATKSDTAPTVATATNTGVIGNPGVNVANYLLGADWNGEDGNVTTVGSAGLPSASYYGTFDQSGNVWEWNDAVYGSDRGLRGGGYEDGGLNLRATFGGPNPFGAEGANFGFRLATIALPSVTTGPASIVTSGGARLNGMVNPGGRVTTAQFEYGANSPPSAAPSDFVGYIGDSIMATNEGGSSVDQIISVKSLGYINGINYAQSGAQANFINNTTASGGNPASPNAYTTHQAGYMLLNNVRAIVCGGGVNSILGTYTWTTFNAETYFDDLLAACQAAHVKLYVEEIWPARGAAGMNNTLQANLEDWNANLRDWVDANDGVELIETYAVMGDPGIPENLNPAYSLDGLHPNAAGIAAHADLLLEKLQGITITYGSTASVTLSPNNGTIEQAVSADITGLTPNTLYHYRLTATHATVTGIGYGTDQTFTTPLADTDGDGVPDIHETGTGIYVSPTNTGTSPTISDSDGDGLTDGQEVNTYHSNPNIADTDGDGFNDGFEVSTGFSPTSAASTPDALSSILTGVEYRFNAALGVSYRIESSTDLATWTTLETPIIGTGGVIARFYSTEGQQRQFFRSRRN